MIYLSFDTSKLEAFGSNFSKAIKKATDKALTQIAAATHAHIIEEANKKLHSTKDLYIENIQRFKDDDGTWYIVLDSSVVWIDDGAKAQDMLPFFLKSPKAKTAKDGSKYMIVPFQHNKDKMTAPQKDLLSAIKSELSSIGVNIKKTETDKNGAPKLGLVRSLDITTKPLKHSEGPGQGSGPIGAVRQGASGIPFLKGVRVYQHMTKDKRGNDAVSKSVVTFRTVSNKRKNPNAWHSKGSDGVKIMDESATWALKEFDTKIMPSIIEQITKNT